MLSWRLWQQVSRPDFKNPIVKRLGNTPKSIHGPTRTSRLRRLILLAALIGLIIIIFNPAQIFILLLVLPMLLITLVVSAPLLLPLVALLAGAYLVAEVISAIAREKHQHTYELMCACTEGALYANWSCATGILHRELIIMLLWQALRRRLNSSREPAGQRGVAAVHGVG